jgi:YgiT-type zinc finger domain-containing protein
MKVMVDDRPLGELSAVERRIREQAACDNVRLTLHAQDELVEEEIELSDGLEAHSCRNGDTNAKESLSMKCTIAGCQGDYESRTILHTLRRKDQVAVIDHVPAEVCPVCGDTLLRPATVRRIEELLCAGPVPTATVPLYEYTGSLEPQR